MAIGMGWGEDGRGRAGHMPKPEEAASQPQLRRHSPTARSSQRHAPSADTARASQERRGRGKRREGVREGEGGSGAKVSTGELDKGTEINGKKNQPQHKLRVGGSNNSGAEKVTRWRQRMRV